jgi:hypothetical protein
MVNNAPIQEIKIAPTVGVEYTVQHPITFPPDCTKNTLELLGNILPKGYKIVKEDNE